MATSRLKLWQIPDVLVGKTCQLYSGQSIGLGSGKGRLEFNDLTYDEIHVHEADLVMDSGKYIGLGSTKGRLGFLDATNDSLVINAADLQVDDAKWIGLGSSAARLTFYSSGNVVACSHAFSVPSGQALYLEGYGGDSYLRYNSNQIEVYVDGTRRAYCDSTGWHNG